MKFDTLYKKTSTGKIQEWKIWVNGNTVHSSSGQTDGKKILSKDVVREGKNTGRANATTKEEQAVAEAKSKHTGKLKSGYVTSVEDAQEGKTDKVITGGYVPMTALVFEKAEKHIKFPCAVQPKLDGLRCCTSSGLFTRSRKPIKMVPHILKVLEKYELMGITFDGELYNHDYKDDFERIISLVKREKELHKDHELVEYHIYDVNIEGTFHERVDYLKTFESMFKGTPIKLVPTLIATDREHLIKIYEEFLDQGYEGAMARNLDSPYENKRSKHLQKMKLFQDAEFKVIGITEGRGKLAGHVGSFICEIDDDKGKRTFKAKADGKQSMLKTYFENEDMWKNKIVTVKFQNYSNRNHVPRFPVAIRFRDGDY